MLKPAFILKNQFIAFYNSLHCSQFLLTSSTICSKYFCSYSDKSIIYEGYEVRKFDYHNLNLYVALMKTNKRQISETMASKNSKKPKLSDSESESSASSASASDSEHVNILHLLIKHLGLILLFQFKVNSTTERSEIKASK